MSIADVIKRYGLPRTHRVHWSPERKAGVVRAVHDRAISFHEARARYLLSRSEFEQWEREYSANLTSMSSNAAHGAHSALEDA
jgi:PHD/YefM family antitoxin component YafN of YafNO toxin-antitoxin module